LAWTCHSGQATQSSGQKGSGSEGPKKSRLVGIARGGGKPGKGRSSLLNSGCPWFAGRSGLHTFGSRRTASYHSGCRQDRPSWGAQGGTEETTDMMTSAWRPANSSIIGLTHKRDAAGFAGRGKPSNVKARNAEGAEVHAPPCPGSHNK